MVHGELQQIRDALAGAPDLEAMLENPEIDSRVKADVLARVAAGSDETVVNFLRLIAEKGRAAEIPEIVAELDTLVAAENRVLDVELTTAHELSDDGVRPHSRADRDRVGPQGAGGTQGGPRPDRRHRPPGRIDEARRERARPAPTSSQRPDARKELVSR